eukprot:TRINITY_DN91196_c0_g1_i1.p1 TRINITY_DN91196_c0_g1~~TRINITY_DN91196_c0_g1_i1.p1  ORF type:complete len:995 (-),score=206.20 TRINITY_DN91196_c0_g1_i1:108-3092(-)
MMLFGEGEEAMRGKTQEKNELPLSPDQSPCSSGGIAVLQEKVDETYEPTDKEINDYAEWLGMDAEEDKDLFWIARKGLKTPLPKPWQPCESASGDIFYFNPESGESKWDHPCDDELRQLYKSEKAAREAKVDKASVESVGVTGGSCKLIQSIDTQPASEEQFEHPKHDEPSIEVDNVESIRSISSSGDDTPPKNTAPRHQEDSESMIGGHGTACMANADDLTGKALPPPPSQAEVVTQSSTAKPIGSAESAGTSLGPPMLAPLGPLPPLSFPTNAAGPSASTRKTEGISDALGSPLDLLAGLGLGPGSSVECAPTKSIKKSVGMTSSNKPVLPPKPPVLDFLGEDDKGSASFPLVSPAAQPPPDEILTPPLPPSGLVKGKPPNCISSEGADQDQGADSQSPPTPQLASILAAELQPEEQLSLWSQIEEEEACKVPSVPKEREGWDRPLRPPALDSPGPEGSLEFSSLSCVLELSNLVPDVDTAAACEIVEELQQLEDKGRPVPTDADILGDKQNDELRSTSSSQVTELRRRREQLERKSSDCKHSMTEAKSNSGLADTGGSWQQTQGKLVASSDDKGNTQQTKLGGEQVLTPFCQEVQELMGSGGFRDTLKVRWDDAAIHVADGIEKGPNVAPPTGTSSLAAAQRVAILEAELSALAARVKSVESGFPQNDIVTKTSKSIALCSSDHVPEMQAELHRLRWELRERQKESASVERQLQDCHHAASLEQAAHSSTKAGLRESQRETQRLQSQLKFREAECERLTAELQRCQAELAAQTAAAQQFQMQVQVRESELSQTKLALAAVHPVRLQQERTRCARDRDLFFEAKSARRSATLQNMCTPSPCGSSSGSIREVKCLIELSADSPDQEELAPEAADGLPERKKSPTRSASVGMQRCGSSARLCHDMADALRSRRRELRKQHAELEEDRKQWRSEARKLRKCRSASEGPVQSESMSHKRAALDARATALNRSIGEYRAMQRMLTSSALKAAPAGGA